MTPVTILDEAEADIRRRYQRFRRSARRLLHHACVGFFRFENNRAGRVDNQFEKGDVDRRQYQRHAEQQRKHRQADDGNVHAQRIDHGLAQIGEDAPAEPDGLHDGAEIVFEQH